MKKIINAVEGTVTFTFDPNIGGDGTKTPIEPVVFTARKASEAMRGYAALHGFSARIGDAAALSKDATNGYRVTEEMRRREVLAMVAHYESGTGDWNMRASGPRAASQNPAIAALATALGLSYEATMAKLAEDAVMAMKAGE